MAKWVWNLAPWLWTMESSSICRGRCSVDMGHRRRIKTEERAKVVAAVWGEECIQFLAKPAVLPSTILNNRMNCTRMI